MRISRIAWRTASSCARSMDGPAPDTPRRESVQVTAPAEYEIVDRRTVMIAGFAIIVAIGAGLAAQLLLRLIALCTNIAFYGHVSIAHAEPAGGHNSVVAILLTP